MEYRSLGSTGLRVSILGLGCNRLGAPGRTRAEMVRLLEYAVDTGVTFYDTADVYAGGESERLLGEVFGRGRHRVVIATKVGLTPLLPPRLLARALPVLWVIGQYAPWFARARYALARRNFSPEYLRLAVERCRRRLRMDCIDVLQLHSPPASVMQRDDALATLERLRTEGAIRSYGITVGNWQQRISLPAHAGLSTLQFPISVVGDGAVHGVLDWAVDRGLGVVGNQPFQKGALLRRGAGFGDRPAGLGGARSVAQAALRAVTQLTKVSTVIAGTIRIDHLKENLAAIDAPPLTPDETKWLRSALTREKSQRSGGGQ